MTATSQISKRSKRRPQFARRTERAGFTLLELVVVMVIAGILFVAAQPSFSALMRGAQERAALRRLVGLLNSARTEAVASGRLVRVCCDPGRGELWAEAQLDPTGDRSAFELLRVLGRAQVMVPDSLHISKLLAGGRDTRKRQAQLYFYPDGRTDGLLLVLADGRGREITVELSAATGRVTVGA